MRRKLARTRLRRSILGTAGLAALLGAAPAAAQQVTPPPDPARVRLEQEGLLRSLSQSRDPLADAFFPPEVVMRHQQAIGLTPEQRAAIVSAISEAQPRFVEAQWQLEPETAALSELVRGDRVDEQAVLAQIDRVLEIERQIKRLQVELLVRIKNQLTTEQQQQLARLGAVRLRGYLDSGRPRPFPTGSMFMPAEAFKGSGDFLAPDHGLWLDDAADWKPPAPPVGG
jgi:Spy/CpxP family protein refolding chaperone